MKKSVMQSIVQDYNTGVLNPQTLMLIYSSGTIVRLMREGYLTKGLQFTAKFKLYVEEHAN